MDTVGTLVFMFSVYIDLAMYGISLGPPSLIAFNKDVSLTTQILNNFS